MPVKGETRTKDVRGTSVTQEFDGYAWHDKKSTSATVSSAPVSDKPKVKTEGYSSLKDTQEKSLSQLLKEREEKRRKAAVIREGGK